MQIKGTTSTPVDLAGEISYLIEVDKALVVKVDASRGKQVDALASINK